MTAPATAVREGATAGRQDGLNDVDIDVDLRPLLARGLLIGVRSRCPE